MECLDAWVLAPTPTLGPDLVHILLVPRPQFPNLYQGLVGWQEEQGLESF